MIYILLSLLSGIGATLQGNVNNLLRVSLNNPVMSALISFGVGTAALLVMSAMTRSLTLTWAQVQTVPWYQWTGGLLGAVFVYSIIVALPELGSGNVFSLIIAGQIISAVIVDHFGLLGSTVHVLTIPRLIGVVLLIVGVWLVQKF